MKAKRFITVCAVIGTLALASAGCAGGSSGAGAMTDYPTKAVDLTIPFGPGGATDLAARAMAEGLSDEFGVPVNPTNREGANQITAVSYVSQAKPDGYTLLADGGGSSTIQSLLDDLPYDWDDRTFIAQMASGSHAYAVSSKSGIKNLDELARVAKNDPSSFSVAWLGGTSTSDFATLQFLQSIDVDPGDVKLVPFSGTGDAMQAAAAGDVDMAAGGSSSVNSLYSSGDLVPLALTAADPNLPDLPLTADEGYPDLNLKYWVGVSGPADIPEDVVEDLTTTLEEMKSDKKMKKTFDSLGMKVDIVTGNELKKNVQAEAEEFAELDDLVD